jgi:hypothetical protein
MTRFVIDTSAVLHLVREGIEVPDTHELLAPTLAPSRGSRRCANPRWREPGVVRRCGSGRGTSRAAACRCW